METDWKDSSFIGGDGCGGGGGGGDNIRGQNSNLTNNVWDIWDMSTNAVTNNGDAHYCCSSRAEPSVINALLFGHVTDNTTTAVHDGAVRWNSVRHGVTDPHMMCLKLGKRHYCGDTVVGEDRHMEAESSPAAAKRGINIPPYSYYATTTGNRLTATKVASATRCQVEGCHVALGGAKEYYRRHKVCEMHSKAPKVVVFGLQQRFCQQCSRFHEVTEFDESKRSCRRRLQGHNLRRRKGTLSNSLPPNFLHSQENDSMMKRRLGSLSTLTSSSPLSMSSYESKPVCVLSLLSSPKTEPWISSSELSSKCSDALFELIAANRATSGHFLNQNSSSQPIGDETTGVSQNSHMWDRFSHTTMSLDLKQAPALDFGIWSMKEKPKEPEEWTDCCWSNIGGANVV